MSKITQLNERSIAVEIPEDAADFNLHYLEQAGEWDVPKLVFSSEIQDPLKCGGDMLRLPPGSWSILGKGDQIMENTWQDIGFGNSVIGKEFLKSRNIDPSTTLILKKQ